MSVVQRFAKVLDLAPTGLLLGERWIPASERAPLRVEDPATGETIATIADATIEDASTAISIADEHRASWAATAPRVRADILRRTYELMVERQDELATLMTLEMGKPLAESRSEVVYAAEFLRWFSEEAVRVPGSWRKAPDGASRLLVTRGPVGPSLFVTPWNFPLAMGTRKLGPALAAGCTVIVKPAKQTPLSMLALGALLLEAGLPRGVLSILPTSDSSGVVARVIDDPRLRKLSFTGSTEVGQRLAAKAGARSLRTSLELGGNAPFIVFDDADLERAVEGAVRAKLRNNGEACTAANRFYVQSGIADEFAAELAARFEQLRVGAGYEESTTLGPLIDRQSVEKVDALVTDAVQQGADVLASLPVPAIGSFASPTVLDRVPPSARAVREEIFGPIAPIVRFTNESEVIEWSNASEYGLASYLYTRDLDRAVRMIERLDVGMIGVNRGVLSNVAAPFGGVKSSGIGREGGDEGIDEYLDVKYAALDVPA